LNTKHLNISHSFAANFCFEKLKRIISTVTLERKLALSA